MITESDESSQGIISLYQIFRSPQDITARKVDGKESTE